MHIQLTHDSYLFIMCGSAEGTLRRCLELLVALHIFITYFVSNIISWHLNSALEHLVAFSWHISLQTFSRDTTQPHFNAFFLLHFFVTDFWGHLRPSFRDIVSQIFHDRVPPPRFFTSIPISFKTLHFGSFTSHFRLVFVMCTPFVRIICSVILHHFVTRVTY